MVQRWDATIIIITVYNDFMLPTDRSRSYRRSIYLRYNESSAPPPFHNTTITQQRSIEQTNSIHVILLHRRRTTNTTTLKRTEFNSTRIHLHLHLTPKTLHRPLVHQTQQLHPPPTTLLPPPPKPTGAPPLPRRSLRRSITLPHLPLHPRTPLRGRIPHRRHSLQTEFQLFKNVRRGDWSV